MLTGTLKYHRKDENGTIITDKFTVKAVDISTTFMGKISTNSYRGIHLMAGEQDEDALWERRFNVGMSTVKVQTYIYKDEKGKNKKSPVNFDFFCKLGAIIRYIKTHCSKENMVGYMGLDDASGEYTPESIMSFNIPFECGEGYLGTMSLRLSEIYSIHFKTDEFELDLDTDPSVEDEIFYEIKNVNPKGFRLTEEYLGFPLKPVDINTDALRRASITGFYDSLDDIIANNPEKDYNWLLKNNYVIVTDDMLEEVCEKIMNHKGYVYYDTETTGLNITFKSRLGADFGDQLVGVVLTINEGEAYFFPTQMKSIPNLCGGDHFYFMERYMRPILEGKELVAHNMAFDWKVAYIYDINANIVHDTMALYKLTVGAELKNFPIGLKELTRNFLFRDSLELSDLVVDDKWGISDVKFWDLPAELVRLYACADTDNTMGLLLNALRNDLLQKYNAKRIYEIEISFSFAVAYQEFYGHKIDIDNLEVLHEEIDKGLKENMDKMVEIVGYEFNPNSPPQLLRIMYTELGIPPQISRKTGRLTTDKDTLNYLNELEDINGNKMYPFVGYLLKYRTFEGVRKIIDKFPELATTDGYLFSKVMQYGTTTGRVSINTPNYQSYNDPIKKNIVPREGYYMFDTDYSSVEYRVLGNMAGNEMIKQGFVDPDFDYHAYQASRIYNVPYVAITKQLRKAAKGINFGLPYGMGDESLGIRVFGKKSEENTRKAADLRAKYFKGQEDIKDFFEVARTKGVQEGYTETYFGRRRYYHRSDFSVNAIRRQAGNQVIQGTAADIYKLAVGRVFKRICKEGWLGKVLLSGFIHDELLGEVHKSIDPVKFLKVLREEFEVKISDKDGKPWCPLYMGFGWGMSWYEAKSVELPIKLQWELVDKYGETGHPTWDGDSRDFCDNVPDMLREFAVRDIRRDLLDPSSQGEPIKPALNTQLMDLVKEDILMYEGAVKDSLSSLGYADASDLQSALIDNMNNVVQLLDNKYHIQSLYKNEDGGYTLDTGLVQVKNNKKVAKKVGTQEAIDIFCMLHDTDRSQINILDIPDVSSDANSANNQYEASEIEKGYDEDEDVLARKEELIESRVKTLGMYLDVDEKTVYLQMIPIAKYMTFIKAHSNMNKEGYNIVFKDCIHGKTHMTQSYIKSADINIIQSMYLQYFKEHKQSALS